MFKHLFVTVLVLCMLLISSTAFSQHIPYNELRMWQLRLLVPSPEGVTIFDKLIYYATFANPIDGGEPKIVTIAIFYPTNSSVNYYSTSYWYTFNGVDYEYIFNPSKGVFEQIKPKKSKGPKTNI